jgi:hypothetical protein
MRLILFLDLRSIGPNTRVILFSHVASVHRKVPHNIMQADPLESANARIENTELKSLERLSVQPNMALIQVGWGRVCNTRSMRCSQFGPIRKEQL